MLWSSARIRVEISQILQWTFGRRKCSREALVVYHIVVMHSPCTLACPTLSVWIWSCVQVHGLGLRTQTRGFKGEARDQKNKIWERICWFRLDFWFFLVLHCVTWFWGRKPQKHMCFFGFRRFPIAKSCLNPGSFWFFIQKPKNTCFFLFSPFPNH